MRVWGGVEQSVTARFGPGRRTTDYAQRDFARPFPAAAIPLRQRRSTPIAPILRNHSARAAVPRHFTWYLDLWHFGSCRDALARDCSDSPSAYPQVKLTCHERTRENHQRTRGRFSGAVGCCVCGCARVSAGLRSERSAKRGWRDIRGLPRRYPHRTKANRTPCANRDWDEGRDS